MARKKDAEEDQASKAILDQLQTKTVGPPPSTTGLTGDQLPETVFSLADLERVRNQVTLQLTNLELLNVLNTIGQVTNTQSQSGPLLGTMDVFAITASSSGVGVTGFGDGLSEVPAGEMWQVYGFGINPNGNSGTTSYELRIIGKSSSKTEISTGSSSLNSAFPMQEDIGPIYMGEGAKFEFEATGTFTSINFVYCAVRVR